MNELMIINEDNKEQKTYALYYTINERFYIIYTAKEKDENNYVILHIAKVLKEVNNTEEGIVPTGKYIGLEISDQAEWDNAKINIGEIVSNKQNNTPTSVSYLPVSEINNISIKSSKTFKLREDVVDSIIIETNNEPELPTVNDVELNSTELPEIAPVAVPESNEMPEVAPVDMPVAIEEPSIEESVPNVFDSSISENSVATPAIAPNPFEMQPEVEIPTPTSEEPTPINPYEVMQQQRTEEMINALATDDMQDIVATPVIPVSELENNVEETITPIKPETSSVSVLGVQPSAPVEATITEEHDTEIAPVAVIPTLEESNTEIPTVEPTIEVPVAETNAGIEQPQEVISSESFVDSIVADVSDILDKGEEQSPEEKEDYERLYNDALEKTVELEKELAELHSKLNNIKNIIE